MAEASSTFGANNILIHLGNFGVIVCKTCAFAVQPSALPSHLLRHQIYRNERRRLLEHCSSLTLLEPDEVPIPINAQPVPHLTVHRGLKCESLDCDHTCISSKRMNQHWSERHNEHDSRKVRARPAYLQTFFRGNKIRYFEVSGPGEDTLRQRSLSKELAEPSSEASSTQGPATPVSLTADPRSPDQDLQRNDSGFMTLDMQTMRYFHHYCRSTALTLRRNEYERESFWKEDIPQQAFQHPFLMFGMLGLSALHLATLSVDDQAACLAHREASTRYQNAAMADFRSLTREPDMSNSVALIAFGRFFGVQRTVQNRFEWAHNISNASQDSQDTGVPKLLELFFLLRGGHEMLVSLQPLLPRHSDFLLSPEEVHYISVEDETGETSVDLMANIPLLLVEKLGTMEQKLTDLHSRTLLPQADVTEVVPAVTSLLTSFARSYGTPNIWALWHGVDNWLRLVPDQYIRMLSAAQPGALVIFAHWCLLLKRLEPHFWFVHGQAEYLISIVLANLPNQEWRHLVVDLLDFARMM